MMQTNYNRILCFTLLPILSLEGRLDGIISNQNITNVDSYANRRRPHRSLVEAHKKKKLKKCPEKCWNGDHCHSKECKDCFFSCSRKACSRQSNTKCEFWCSAKEDCTKYAKSCSACIFCTGTVQETCTVATFEDVTRKVFGSDPDYWYSWKHSGRSYFHRGSAILFDMNGDNVLDYFNAMHGHPMDKFFKRMELGMGSTDGDYFSLKSISERIICTDAVSCDEQFIDAHGPVVLDLDGDGVLDILISNGGGGEELHPPEVYSFFDNWLFWGEISKDDLTGEEITVFKGGRDAARAAGVEMSYGRGRFNYMFDANGDGLLDMFASQDRRMTNEIKPGILLINQGDKTWKEHWKMKEFSRTMILTDADGDGFANEFILNRSFCYPKRKGPGVDETMPELGPYTQDVKAFCQKRPVGTNAVYRYNSSSKMMEEISKPYHNFWAGERWTNSCCPNGSFDDGDNDCNAISMVSGDFDNDLLADQVLLYSSKLVFFFSSDRPRGALPDSTEYIGLEIRLPNYCSAARSVQLLDINNDGKEELLISCINAGLFLLYTRGSSSKTDWTLDNGCNRKGALGDISNRFLAYPSHREMKHFCDEFYGTEWKTANKVCAQYNKVQKFTSTKSEGVAIYDINNDGFYDIVSMNSFGRLRFFYNNPSINASSNRFIGFKIVGHSQRNVALGYNYHGIGATIILHTRDKNGKWANQFREISSVQHLSDVFGAKDDRIIFGLGENLVPKRIQVHWPNGFVQVLKLMDWTFSKTLKPIEIIDASSFMNSSFRLRSQQSELKDFCLTASSSVNNDLNISNCSEWGESMKFMLSSHGRITSTKFEKYCLVPETSTVSKGVPIVLGAYEECHRSSWLLTSDGRLRYGSSPFVLSFDRISLKAHLWPLEDQRQESKWDFILD